MSEPLEPDQPAQPEAAPDVQPVGPETPAESPDETTETPDEEEEGEPAEAEPPAEQPPTDQPAPQGLSDEEAERIGRQLDKERTRHSNRVSEIMGEWAQPLQPCPLCEPNIPGFIFPAEQTAPRGELHAALLEVLKNPLAPEYETDPTKPACDTCKGLGKIKTGSKVPGQETLMCATCSGKGWVGQVVSVPSVFLDEPPTAAEVMANGGNVPPPDADAWGSPRLLETGMENPNYGRMPQYKDPAFP
jgi:hypothetical protein